MSISRFDTLALSLFTAIDVDNTFADDHGLQATFPDLVVLCQQYGFVPGPDFAQYAYHLDGVARKGLFAHLEELFLSMGLTIPSGVSALNRDFPHSLTPNMHETASALMYAMQHQKHWGNYSPDVFGADPFTGQQNDDFGHDEDADDTFVIGQATRAHKRLRVLQKGDRAYWSQKCTELLKSRAALTPQETEFLSLAIERGCVDADVLATVRFREKLPLLADALPWDIYKTALESPTDVLRLAAHWSQKPADLAEAIRFDLTTAQTKKVLDGLERTATRNIEQAREQVARHSEYWKRLARHMRSDKWSKRYPQACNILLDNRLGKLQTIESQIGASALADRVILLLERPGMYARQLMSLLRLAQQEASGGEDFVLSHFKEILPKVNAYTLLVLLSRLRAPQGRTPHFLPNGSLLWSEPKPVSTGRAAALIEAHLHARLNGSLDWSAGPDAERVLLPTGNRTMSESNERINRGSSVILDFERADTVRVFLHWKDSADVDLSVSLLDDDMSQIASCAYYNLGRYPYLAHSGDITNGSRGAAEYIDVQVGKAIKEGVRWVVITSNIFSGTNFSEFPAYAGVMVRTNKMGKQFDISTVAQKMRLSSKAKWNTVAALDLKTGALVLIDAPLDSANGDNLEKNFNTLSKQVSLYTKLSQYRPTIADALRLMGTPGAPELKGEKLFSEVDTILEKLATL